MGKKHLISNKNILDSGIKIVENTFIMQKLINKSIAKYLTKASKENMTTCLSREYS